MRLRPILIITGLLSLIITTPVHAVTQSVASVPAKFVNYYKSSSGVFAQKAGTENSANLDKQSQININFNLVPDEYRPAIQAAVDIWSQNFKSTVPINVETLWERQANPGVLAAASPGRFFNGFAGEIDSTLWYASAMANALAGKDLDPNNPEITIRINSTNGPSLYLGTDGNCPRNQFDLESIIIHELAHGLGFLSNSEYDQVLKNGNLQRPTPYDAYSQLPDGRRLMDLPAPSAELGAAMTNPLFWSGANGIQANGGIKPKLYTPAIYEIGSSVSHLDEATFSKSPTDSVMTPNLANGEVFHSPGPLATAMMQDMMIKPPAGTPLGIPQAPQNVRALVGDKSAVIYFDAPANARSAQVSSYKVHISPSGIDQEFTESPATITGLKNGTTYVFSITALNSIGASEATLSNSVIPQPNWASSVIDKSADGKYLTQGTFAGKQFILYSDSKHGLIKMATYLKGKWQIKIIDGDSTLDGRTTNDVSGSNSYCVGQIGKKNVLDILYADLVNKDLRLAEFDGNKWEYSVVDGNASAVQDYKEVNRTTTGSDVSVSNACVRTKDGLQVFYRDQSQGIILGATKDGSRWTYEIVDGDKNELGRSTGDVGFHLKALNISNKVYLLYDSVNTVNMENKAIRGEVRLATRTSSNTGDWSYETVQGFGGLTAVAGFDVSLLQQGKDVYAAWLTASGFSIPNPDQISWGLITPISTSISINAKNYGTPTAPISIGDKFVLFNCASRLCAINRSSQSISLVSTKNFYNSARSEWITINKIRYIVSSSDGKLSLFKQP